MFSFILNSWTVIIIAFLGIFSLRRLLFALTTIFTKPDWNLDNIESYQPFVTVLVPCHNEENVISQNINALLNIQYPQKKLEIVVIDDLSSDNTFQIIKDFEKRYTHIHAFQRTKNKVRGKAAALNEALTKFTRGEIIYVVDADHCPKSDALNRLVRHFSDSYIGAVNGRSIPRNRYDSLISSYVYIENLVHNRVAMYAIDKLGLTPAILGSNVCTRRSLYEKIGFYNENRLTEDLDMTLCMYEHGYKVKFDVTSITEHEAPDSIENYILQHLRWNRAYNEVARSDWRKIIFNGKLPLFSRIEQVIFSFGYLDRIFFCIAMGLTILSIMGVNSFHFPYWVWLFFIGLPALEILIGLFVEKERFTMYLRLPLILSMFSVDIFVALKALYQDLIGKPAHWYKTPRAGDRSDIG